MKTPVRRTTIVATLGPASRSPEVIRQMIHAGMDVARINFSHGSHAEHAETITRLRAIAAELDTPITILQDLQGPKVRVGTLPETGLTLSAGDTVQLVPESEYRGQAGVIPLDYPHAAEDAKAGMTVLLADGMFEFEVTEVKGKTVWCRVVEGGVLKSRKGVNFPECNLRLPSLTDKDKQDLAFGLSQNVDWVSLSFVRSAKDLVELKRLLDGHGAVKPIIAKIEKPQAIEHLDEIVAEASGLMVARGDLGVEVSPEKVPLLQKLIIEKCNRAGKPVITATQMLESMIHEPRPTRAEASDVANAIIDGTDAIMLSGETAIGEYPVRAVEMMSRIAGEVEGAIHFKVYPAPQSTETHALTEAVNVIEETVSPRAIVCLTTSGYTAGLVAANRPTTPVIALTTSEQVYHQLNLLWGIKPLLVRGQPDTFEGLVALADATLRQKQLAVSGDKILVLGGIPAQKARGTNFLKIHTLE